MRSWLSCRGKRHVHSILIAEGVGNRLRVSAIREIAEVRKLPVQYGPRARDRKHRRQGQPSGTCWPRPTVMDMRHCGRSSIDPAPSWSWITSQIPRTCGTLLRTARAFDVAGIVIPTDRSASVTPAVVERLGRRS